MINLTCSANAVLKILTSADYATWLSCLNEVVVYWPSSHYHCDAFLFLKTVAGMWRPLSWEQYLHFGHDAIFSFRLHGSLQVQWREPMLMIKTRYLLLIHDFWWTCTVKYVLKYLHVLVVKVVDSNSADASFSLNMSAWTLHLTVNT